MRSFLLSLWLLFVTSDILAAPHLKLGAILPLSGPAATYGNDARAALEFAVREFGDGKVELVWEDDHCDPKTAVAAFQKLVISDRVQGIIGPVCSGPALAILPLLTQSKIVAVSPNATSTKLATPDSLFRTRPDNEAPTRTLFEYLRGRYKKVGLLSEQTDYPQDIKAILLRLAASGGVEIVAADFLSGSADLRSELLRLKKEKVEAIIVNPQAESSILSAARYMKELNLNLPVFAANSVPGSPALLKESGSLMQGLIFADFPPMYDLLTSRGAAYYQKFISRYGEPKSFPAIWAFTVEALQVLLLALDSRDNPARYLSQHQFDGVFGHYSFNANGDVIGVPVVLKRIQRSEPVPLEQIP